MGVIGNTVGDVRYVDLPVTAGTNPTVTFTTDQPSGQTVDLVGIEVLAKGATAAALTVDGSSVGAGAISSFSNNFGSVHSAAPTPGVPTAASGGGAQQNNSTNVGSVNWQSSGTSQGFQTALTSPVTVTATTTLAVSALPAALAVGNVVTVGKDFFVVSATAAKNATSITVTSKTPSQGYPSGTAVGLPVSQLVDRNGAVPAPGAVTPLKATIATAKVISVALTGTVAVLATLPAADGNGFISLPTGTIQGTSPTFTGAADNIPFRVKATETALDTFAGVVRLFLQVTPSDPNQAQEGVSYPLNGVNPRGAGTNAGVGS